MSRYSYAGPFTNPTQGMMVVPNPAGKEGEDETYIIAIPVSVDEILTAVLDGQMSREEAELLRERGWRPHTNGKVFAESEDADEWIENTAEFFERDYEDYCQENSYEIRQMELYELHRNEY